jgi:hypothetical protein
MSWSKHRDAVEVFSFNFGTALEAGDAVVPGSGLVKVYLYVDGGVWEDVTADFVEGAVSISGNILSWRAANGTEATQLANVGYWVRGEVTTELGRTLEHIEKLHIRAEATSS